ncbi:SPJ_0845 family protein [Apilactobacillus xinyiensis]|uniref:Uncharacterized protein n=1 Tax=Apilactobacillus xinyiensis TaxID=2841032 RepID=A0ABT0I1V6_9LACO|nr:SPJ_0845 family protein [Apilactobacillus xinyiensis]MCK8624705.1 hypothetical protein [Apilactobacillus xinyiensis]MCL0318820.1 hypothetical protein [Apilactobacillus xinyiensis]MCL0329938.1 hypothetical protein [Apilactobacillus xinyiensis]
MSLNIQRNADLNAMFDKFAKIEPKDPKKDRFLKKEKSKKDSKKNKSDK